MYETLSEDYDRFVNWDERLAYEMPFIETRIGIITGGTSRVLDILTAPAARGCTPSLWHASVTGSAALTCTRR